MIAAVGIFGIAVIVVAFACANDAVVVIKSETLILDAGNIAGARQAVANRLINVNTCSCIIRNSVFMKAYPNARTAQLLIASFANQERIIDVHFSIFQSLNSICFENKSTSSLEGFFGISKCLLITFNSFNSC